MSTGTVLLLLIVAGLILLSLKEELNRRRRCEELQKEIEKEWGNKPGTLTDRDTFFPYAKEKTEEGFRIDARTAEDLDLRGLFARMDYTRTFGGARALWEMLLTPVMPEDREELLRRDMLADCFAENEAFRNALSAAFLTSGKSAYDPETLLSVLEEKKPLKGSLTGNLLYVPGIALLFVNTAAGLVCLGAALAARVITYFRDRAEMMDVMTSLGYILREIDGSKKVTEALRKVREEQNEGGNSELRKEAETLCLAMEESRKKLQISGLFSGLALTKDSPTGSAGPFGLLLSYVKMLTHYDLAMVEAMSRKMTEQQEALLTLTGTMDYLDACLSVAYFRASLEVWCKPVLVSSGKENRPVYRVKNMTHVLLENPVANSLDAGKGQLITGSNASGKTTFLKTAMISVLLSQSICTCPAESAELSYFRLITSLSSSDSLEKGESYYMAEIKNLQRILQAVQENTDVPVLCAVDELLRGTNTVERIAAGSRVLASLACPGVLPFAATHDIELTEILQNLYENKHFDDMVSDGDISFTYQLKDGKANSRNAIKLLELLGYSEQITERAMQAAASFETTGEWEIL